MRSMQLLCEKGFSAVPALAQRALSGVTGCLENPRDTRDGPEIPGYRAAVLQVRIHFPPAESQVRTCLSREFAFLGREAAVFRGCPGRDERPGSAETRGRGNIWPKGGDISVGPYSSTAPPVMRSATMPRILSRMRDPP